VLFYVAIFGSSSVWLIPKWMFSFIVLDFSVLNYITPEMGDNEKLTNSVGEI
jgi:hypothetical protein